MKNLKTVLLLAALPAAAASLSGQTLLLGWNFDEADNGNAVTADNGSSPQVDGRFFNGSTRTANTPNGYSLGAADVTAVPAGAVDASVFANYNDLGGKLDNLSSFTISTWVNLQADPLANRRIMSAGNAQLGMRIAAPSEGTLSASNFGIQMELNGGAVPFAGINLDAGNSWLFVAFTFDASLPTNQASIYVGTENPANPVYLAKSVNVSNTITDSGVLTNHLMAGAYPGLAKREMNGYLDDVRIYSGAGDLAYIEDMRLSNIPEPRTTALLAGLGALGLAAFVRRRKQNVSSK